MVPFYIMSRGFDVTKNENVHQLLLITSKPRDNIKWDHTKGQFKLFEMHASQCLSPPCVLYLFLLLKICNPRLRIVI